MREREREREGGGEGVGMTLRIPDVCNLTDFVNII